MHGFSGLVEMFVWFLYFVACLSYAVSSNPGLSTRIDGNKQQTVAPSTIAKKTDIANGTRNKRAPLPNPQPTPQLLQPADSIITKRQFMPMVPDLTRREFLPRREFDAGNLLPTPRIIRPLELERGLPLESNHLLRGPIDLERRPFLGQGLVGPPLLPEFHRPVFQDGPPHLMPLNPDLPPRHVFLGQHNPRFFDGPHILNEPMHFGSLGDSPLLSMPHRHHFTEGFAAPPLREGLPEGFRPVLAPHFQEGILPELQHRLHEAPRPRLHFPEGLAAASQSRLREEAQLQHELAQHELAQHELARHELAQHELAQLPHRLQERPHHAIKSNFAPSNLLSNADSNDGSDEATETSEGDDSIESMMNELNKHKAGKAWVTDVNIYDKKRKMNDLASLLEGDDKDDEEEDFDPCVARPCKNGGFCRQKENSRYECVCTRNFKGKHCTVRNRCYPNPCHNRGRCTETVSGFECTCSVGFKGRRCSEKNYCLPNPCLNDGLCNESPDGFVCTCGQGFQGKSCEVKRTACNPNPCLNNAQCILDSSSSFQCVCVQGYSGRTCDSFGLAGERNANGIQRSDIAVPNPSLMACLNNPCMNNGLCRPDPGSEKGFKCVCVSEYKGILCEEKLCKCENNGFCITQASLTKCICKAGYAGDQCEKHTQCNDDTCMHGGMCMEEIGSFKCKCEDGYKGLRCESVDRCNPNPCLHGGSCKDLRDTYQCECPKTYKGKQCEDFNFCFPNPCQNGGTCFGYSGGFQCDCPNGFTGKNCENKLYCNSNPCKNGAQCVEVPNNFKCLCGKGFTGNSCEVQNYCASNPCRNGGSCQNRGNSFKCTCTEHFIGDTCEVFNECFETPCKNGGKCETQPHGGFKCSCTLGFAGPHCEQIDECQPNPCKNDGTCSNNPNGGFTCNCKEGFRGLICAEADPCHPNPCNHGVCAEINGGYVCNCTLGFRGPVCAEIDRCTPNPCQHDALCQEINGGVGYVCQCPVGYKGQICELKDPCNPSPCVNSGSCSETLTGSGYTCKCLQGWMGGRCEDHDPCFPSPCQHGGGCLSSGKNAFKCNCTQGFKGEKCEKIDLCSPNPCRFGSHCIQTDEESYQCVKNLCTPNPCKHDGKCIVVNDEGFECACHNGWRGRNCEDFDPCYSNPCLNGGTCSENSNGGFSCMCNKDFGGKYCGDAKAKAKAEAHWCTSNPCTNGGTCIETDGSYNCRCPIGFSGTICEESVCFPNPCENGGLCVPYYGIALCKCTHEYTGAHCSEKRRLDVTKPLAAKVQNAQYNYVPMAPSTVPASARGLQPSNVVNLPSLSTGMPIASFSLMSPINQQPQAAIVSTAVAPAAPQAASLKPLVPAAPSPPASLPVKANTRTQLDLRPIKTAMTKKDESCIPSPCQHNGMCVMRTDNTPECVCTNDFSGPQCEEIGTYGYSSAPKFFPKDECSHCDENSICVNSHCICKEGYVGDGLECWAESSKDKDWSCDRNPCQNGGTCKYGRSKCVCKLGYTGDFCQNYCPPLVHLSFDKMRGALAVDESGNNNDAMLINGAEIVYEGGKCDSGVSLLGGDILFDGERFWPKPVEAVTIALWLKLDTSKGIQSIFDTVGQKFSNHKEGQYHVEIENGKVRWFHRNEKHDVVFSIISQPLVGEGTWHHIAGTYDAQNAIAKLFLDGDLVAKGPGNGYLSQDWTGKAGIGKHEHPYGDRLLRGMVDEFFIFGCALPRLEILVLMHHCKLYFGKKKDYSKAQQVHPKVISTSVAPHPHNITVPADHWVYSVGEKIHVNADARAGIGKPDFAWNFAESQRQQQLNGKVRGMGTEQRMQQQQRQREQQQQQRLQQRKEMLPYQISNAPANSRQYQPRANNQPKPDGRNAFTKSGINDFKAFWEAWKAKKKAEDAAKKSLTNEETKIEEMYQTLFGAKSQQRNTIKYQNNKPAAQVLEPPAQKSIVDKYERPYINQQQRSGFGQGVLAKQQISPLSLFARVYSHEGNPNYAISEYLKKDFTGVFRPEDPMYIKGNIKSSVPSPFMPAIRKPNPKQNVAQNPRTRNQMAAKQPSNDARGAFLRTSLHNDGINYAAQVRQNLQNRMHMPSDLQQQMQRMRQIYANKRTQQLSKAAPSKPIMNNFHFSQSQWPAPNSVKEFSTNRGIVRVQSVVRPLVKKNPPQGSTNRVELARKQQMMQSHYQNPWAMYNKLKSQISTKRDNYKQADSHATSATTSNTWEGATAPGQKGAGHNYGYGYGYGTGDALKGGGWGQGFGGGGPGVTEAGNHHTPDFNNPNMEWGQGQGWGQGGKGVPQREEYKPAPPSGSSLLSKSGRQAQAPVRHVVQNSQARASSRRIGAPVFLPKGPSIMNFEPSLQAPLQRQGLSLRGNAPVSSPAYQVKYFMNDRGSMGYQNDNSRSMRNEIISNAVADVLKSIEKKKKKRTTKSE